jgi:hypothetical protein
MTCEGCLALGADPTVNCKHITEGETPWETSKGVLFAFLCPEMHITELRSKTHPDFPKCETCGQPADSEIISHSRPIYNTGGFYGCVPTSEATAGLGI